MWWLVTLLVLALIAFFIVKSMKTSTLNKQAEHDRLQRATLDATASAQSGSSADNAQDSSGSANLAQSAGAVAAAAATAGVAAHVGEGADSAATAATGSSTSTAPAEASGATVHTSDTVSDVREMIKILNLDGPDASRLDISRQQLTALRKNESSGFPDSSSLDDIASKLRSMLA